MDEALTFLYRRLSSNTPRNAQDAPSENMLLGMQEVYFRGARIGKVQPVESYFRPVLGAKQWNVPGSLLGYSSALEHVHKSITSTLTNEKGELQYEMGNLTLAKGQFVVTSWKMSLPGCADCSGRTATLSFIEQGESELLVINTHLEFEAAPEQAQSLVDVIQALEFLGSDVPILLIGDLNSWWSADDRAALDILTAPVFCSSTKGFVDLHNPDGIQGAIDTVVADGSEAQKDHMMLLDCSEGVQVSNAIVIEPEAGGICVSDHRFLRVDLVVH